MAVGNTFGATALSSYGGFWLSLAIVLTPGGFEIVSAYEAGGPTAFNNAFGFFLAGWFIFTTILLICTLRSTVAFFLLFFFLDLAFLFLFLAHLEQSAEGVVHSGLTKAGGYFGLFAAFMAWYNALAGIADDRYVVSYNFMVEMRVIKLTHLQQLLFRHSSCTLPMVSQGPRAPRPLPKHQQDRARDCLNASVPRLFLST